MGKESKGCSLKQSFITEEKIKKTGEVYFIHEKERGRGGAKPFDENPGVGPMGERES